MNVSIQFCRLHNRHWTRQHVTCNGMHNHWNDHFSLFFESHSTFISPSSPTIQQGPSCTEGQGCDGYFRDQTLIQKDLCTLRLAWSTQVFEKKNAIFYPIPILMSYFLLPITVKLLKPVSLPPPPMHPLTYHPLPSALTSPGKQFSPLPMAPLLLNQIEPSLAKYYPGSAPGRSSNRVFLERFTSQ